jgi:hypothetical protein
MNSNLAISLEDLRALPIYSRVAVAASVVEPVLRLYSDYFWRKFLVRQALDLAWRFASGEPTNHADIRNLVDYIGKLSEDADDEGYAFRIMFMHAHVIAEIQEQEGKSAYAALEGAEYGFAAHHVFVQGFVPDTKAVPENYVRSLELTVAHLARQVLGHYASFGGKPIRRQDAQLIELPKRVPPLTLSSTVKPKRQPPIHERIAG